MRLHRLVGILLLLESRRIVKAREMAEAFETSERTIYRDIDTLCEAGVPITSDAGPAGGFSLMQGYTIISDSLYCDDVISLYLSGIGIHPTKYSEANLNLKKSILKLERSLPPQFLPDLNIAKERFYFDPNIWWKEQKPLLHLDLLRQAVWQSSKLQILYTKASKNLTQTDIRKVLPYGLVVKNMDWYLVAYCETRQDIRVFRCDRIIEAVLIPSETFSIPDDFSLEVFWKDWVSEFEGVIKDDCPPYYPVRIKLLDQKLTGLGETNLSFSNSSTDEVTVNLYSYENACNKLLELSNRVEVLEPTVLRDYVISQAQSTLRIYLK